MGRGGDGRKEKIGREGKKIGPDETHKFPPDSDGYRFARCCCAAGQGDENGKQDLLHWFINALKPMDCAIERAVYRPIAVADRKETRHELLGRPLIPRGRGSFAERCVLFLVTGLLVVFLD